MPWCPVETEDTMAFSYVHKVFYKVAPKSDTIT